MTTEPRAIALDRIGDTPPDFKRFVEEAKAASAIDDVLLDDLDPAFLAEAIGDCAVF